MSPWDDQAENQRHESEEPNNHTAGSGDAVDLTTILKQLDSTFEQHDKDGAIRAITIKSIKPRKRSRQRNVVIKAETVEFARLRLQGRADALSRSGSLPIAGSELHVVVAVTYYFENDVMDTVIQDFINLVEKPEKLMVASAIHQQSALNLLCGRRHRERLSRSFPLLLQNQN